MEQEVLQKEESAEPQNASPLVSIGLPTRNRAKLLSRALQDLRGQTYGNLELIISDNASTDETETLAQSFAARDPRIRYIRQKENINGMRNHEFVLRGARGKYFMWASDDDGWDPRFVETLVRVLETHPEYGVAMTHYYQRFVNDPRLGTKLVTHNFTPLGHKEAYRQYLRGRATPVFFFGLYRTNLLKKIFRRPTPSCFNGLMLTLEEVSLATRLYSVPLALHTQSQDSRLHIVRHPDNPYTVGELEPFAVTRYVTTIPLWLLSSRAIPLSRKFLIFGPWISRTWLYKRKVVYEIWRFFKNLIASPEPTREAVGALINRWLVSTSNGELADILSTLRAMARQDRGVVLGGIKGRETLGERASPFGDERERLRFLETHL